MIFLKRVIILLDIVFVLCALYVQKHALGCVVTFPQDIIVTLGYSAFWGILILIVIGVILLIAKKTYIPLIISVISLIIIFISGGVGANAAQYSSCGHNSDPGHIACPPGYTFNKEENFCMSQEKVPLN